LVSEAQETLAVFDEVDKLVDPLGPVDVLLDGLYILRLCLLLMFIFMSSYPSLRGVHPSGATTYSLYAYYLKNASRSAVRFALLDVLGESLLAEFFECGPEHRAPFD
jgi:hypothetical protein